MSKERKALDDFIKDYLFLCEKLCTNKQEKMLLDSNSPYNVLKTYLEAIDNANPSEALEYFEMFLREMKDVEQCPSNYFESVYWKYKYTLETTIKTALLKAQVNARSEEILQKYYQEGITLDSVRALKKEMAELKGQVPEPKHYLKWKDLKFTKKTKEMLVKLGDTTYPMQYYKVNDHTNKVCISSFQFIEIYDIRFFNDLHLERVEE